MKTRAFALLLAVAGLASFSACTTVTPHIVPAAVASYDEGGQNSGIFDVATGGRIVTVHFRDRYNEAVKVYGKDFAPPLTADEGLTVRPDGSWFIDLRHYSYALQMNKWKEAAIKP